MRAQRILPLHRGHALRHDLDFQALRQFVVHELGVADNRVAVLPGLLALNTISEITKAPRDDLRFEVLEKPLVAQP